MQVNNVKASDPPLDSKKGRPMMGAVFLMRMARYGFGDLNSKECRWHASDANPAANQVRGARQPENGRKLEL